MNDPRQHRDRIIGPVLAISAFLICSLCAPNPAMPEPCPLEMIAYWRADSDATDHMKHHDGTLMGGATFGDGHCEQAFSLDGIDDCVSIPSSSDFNLRETSAKSIVLWWNADTLSGTLVSRRRPSEYALGLLLAIEPSDYYLHVYLGYWARFTAAYTTSQWYQVAITKDGENWKLYQDGLELPISPSSNWPWSHDITAEDVPLLIGQDGGASLPNFDGLIDEVAVYNKTLSPEEVLALYQSSCHYCDRVPTATPTPTPTPTPSPTPSPEGYKTPTPTPSPIPTTTPTPWECFTVAGEVRNAYTDQPIGEAYIRTVTSDHSSDPSFNSATGTFSISACSGISSGDVRVEACCLSYLPNYADAAYTDWQDVSGLIVYLTPESSDPQIGSGDYNGDGSSDIAIFRPTTIGQWAIRSFTRYYFGNSLAQLTPADYDGDGTTDVSVWFPWFNGLYYYTGTVWAVQGLTRIYYGNFSDIPLSGDWDGDGSADLAVFHGATNLWAVRSITRFYFGQQGDQPLSADFTGDGSRTAAVFRASQGLWAIRDLTRIYLGNSADQVNTMDFTGDGTDLPAIFRSSSGLWAAYNLTRFYFGISGDKLVPGDFLGSGQDISAVFRGSSGLWGVRDLTRVYFGSTSDIPVTR